MYSLKNISVSNIGQNNKSNLSTALTKRSNNQSPKLQSRLMKDGSATVLKHDSKSEFQPYFSQLDINPKFVSKGVSLPKQYIRPTTHAPFLKKRANQNSALNLTGCDINKQVERLNEIAINDIESSSYIVNEENKEGKEKVLGQSKTARLLGTVEMQTTNIGDLKQSYENEHKSLKDFAKLKQDRPISHYQPAIPSVKEFQNIVRMSYHPEKTLKQRLLLKEIKLKSNESDIFFTKPLIPVIQKINRQQLASENISFDKIREVEKDKTVFIKKDYMDSDIFCLKNNYMSMTKTGETFLKNPGVTSKKFGGTTESNSAWGPNFTNQNLLNHTSINYHILNPGLKNISQTRKDIEANNLHPTHKEKGMFEYYDLTRVSAPNPNKKFKEAINTNPNSFNKVSNLCQNFRDLHGKYRDLCDAPYFKKEL